MGGSPCYLGVFFSMFAFESKLGPGTFSLGVVLDLLGVEGTVLFLFCRMVVLA